MFKTIELDLTNSDQWQEFLEKIEISRRDIYFSPDYYRLYENLGDGKARCFVLTGGDEIALYPFLINSIDKEKYNLGQDCFDIQGAYGYNGVISSTDDAEFIAVFNDRFTSYCEERNIIAEFMRFHPLLENKDFSKSRMNIIEDRATVYLDLRPNLDEIWQNQFSSQIRNKIRKAQKRGYSSRVIQNPSFEEIQTFITLYRENMEMVDAEDYFFFNKDYFLDTFKYLGSHSYLLNIIDDEENIISSTILFKYGDYFHYHLSGRSKDAISWASNFLYSEAIELAKRVGAKFFHFGGGRSGDPKDSLLRFKKGFSNSLSTFYLGKKIHNKEIYQKLEEKWNEENPELRETYKNFLLKYRIETINK